MLRSKSRRQQLISAREYEVLDLILREHTSKEISHRLFISLETVLSHRKNVMAKLEARNTAGLVRRAYETGIFSINQ